MRKQETSSTVQFGWQFAPLKARKKKGYKYCHSDSFTHSFLTSLKAKQIRGAFVKELIEKMPERLARNLHTISTKCRKRNYLRFKIRNK